MTHKQKGDLITLITKINGGRYIDRQQFHLISLLLYLQYMENRLKYMQTRIYKKKSHQKCFNGKYEGGGW
jgi:hypothetical protein